MTNHVNARAIVDKCADAEYHGIVTGRECWVAIDPATGNPAIIEIDGRFLRTGDRYDTALSEWEVIYEPQDRNVTFHDAVKQYDRLHGLGCDNETDALVC